MSSVDRLHVKSLRFLLTGGVNTVVFYGLYLLLLRLGWPYVLALTAEYAGGIVAGYLMNRYWTFRSHGRPERGFLKYCATYGVVFVLNLAFLGAIVKLGLLGPALGQIAAFSAATVVSFLLQNFWVFHA
jgi:putative flippase GtrA